MFEKRIAEDLAFGVEAYKHLQVSAEAASGTLHSGTEVFALSILGLIDDIGEFLALGIVLAHGVGLGNLQVADAHHRLDTVGKSLRLLVADRTFRQVVHISQDTTHDDGYSREHQHHIRQCRFKFLCHDDYDFAGTSPKRLGFT